MEKEDKIFEDFKSAAKNEEAKDFSAMDKVWSRVEDKLDNKKDKKAMLLWKKIAVAASLLLVTTLGYQFFKNNPNDIKLNQPITTNDSIKKVNPNAVATSEIPNPTIKNDAEQILKNQINTTSQVAVGAVSGTSLMTISTDSLTSDTKGFYSPKPAITDDIKKADAKDVELFINKNSKVSNVQKEEPLVVIDNKVEKKSIRELQFNDADSLVVLKEPLYIINGVEYTEQQLFGPNPTSPYTPLNKQEIETLSILQDEKAIEIYGNKGKKGVVIITTKNGKPVNASKKAK